MKLKNILFIAIAILTIGLFVACNDDVVVAAKDNNVAYTQVLESNGAFEYAGTKYETLQDALNAIENGKLPAEKTIKVLRNVTGPVAAIGKNQSIVLDLNGNALTFIDVTDSALSVGNGTTFTVKNGSMSLFDTSNADLAVVKADGAKSLTLEGVNINTAGQYALVADGTTNTTIDVKGGSVLTGNADISNATLSIADSSKLDGALDAEDTSVTLGADDSETETSAITGEIKLTGSSANPASFNAHKNTLVTGKMTATGTSSSSDVIITVNNEVGPVYMEYGTITVNAFGHATMGLVDTGNLHNVYVVTTTGVDPYNAITLPEGSTVVINTGICVVAQATGSTYYGSIYEALQDANAGLTIVLLADDAEGLDSSLTIPYNVTIDLAGHTLTSAISSAYKLTLTNSTSSTSKLTETLTGTGTTAEFVVDNVTVTGAVSGASSLKASKATFNETVTVTGALTSNNSTFVKAVSAASINDGDSTVSPALNGSTFKDSVTATGALVSYKSTFSATEANKTISGNTLSIASSTFGTASNKEYALSASGADSTGKAISITSTTGCVKSLTATAGSINVANGTADAALTVTGNVLAGVADTKYFDVTLAGKSGANVVVKDNIIGNDITLERVTANGNVTAKNVADDTTTTAVDETDNGSITATNSTFTPSTGSNKELEGNTISVSDSTFNATDSYYYALEANGADPDANTSALTIATTTGSVASLTATAGSITVDNSNSSSSQLWIISHVNAKSSTAQYYDVTVVANSTQEYSIRLGGEINAKDFVADYVKFLNSWNITASTVRVSNSDFVNNSGTRSITVSGTDYKVGTDDHAALEITNSKGSVGSLTASGGGSIKVNNSGAANTLTATGNVRAYKTVSETITYYDVTLVGKSGANVIVNGTIDGNDIDLTQTTVNDNVTAHDNAAEAPAVADLGSVVATNSTFDTLNTLHDGGEEGPEDDTVKKVSGSILNISTSTFTATVTSGTASYFYALEASGADPDENTSALKITTSTGTVASLKTTSGSINVANGSASAALTVTGNVTANKTVEETTTYYDVTLVGNANTIDPETVKNVVVNGAISGNDVSITYASVNVVAANTSGEDAGDFTSKNSVISGAVTASGTVTDGEVSGNVYSKGSLFHGNIQAAGDLTFYTSVFCNGCDPYITSVAGGDILIIQATGETKDVITQAPTSGATAEASGIITIDNSGLTSGNTLTTGALSATYNDLRGDVTVTGQGSSYLTVTGSVTGDDITATRCTFNATTTGKTIIGKTLSITDSAFDSSTAEYALTASGADPDENTSALKITNTTGRVVSLTATAGSIIVANGTASATLTVTENVSAFDYEYYDYEDVTLTGNFTSGNANVVVNGDITGHNVYLLHVSAYGDINGHDNSSTDLGCVIADESVIGDSIENDNVYSRNIQISNSQLVLNRLARSETVSADTVMIDAPLANSHIADIATDKLDVTATDANLVVDNVSITGTSTINSIAGGTYKALTFRGEGVVSSILTITKGQFFNPGSTSGSEDDTAGVFVFNTGTTRIAGTYYGGGETNPSNYSVFIWGLDNMNSTTSIECAYVQSSKLSGLSGIVAKVNQTLSSQHIYINYDPYHEETDHMVEISSGAPEYPLYTSGTVYNVVLNFAYTGGTGDYSIESGLFVTNTAMPNLNFGTNNISVTGRVFVTGEASVYSTLYSNDFVYLATAPTSSTHEWIVALPAEAEYGQFKYKAGSYSLASKKLMIAKNRILISNSTDGTDVASTVPNTESFWQYHYNDGAASVTVYCAKGTRYDVAHAADGDISNPATYTKISSWGLNVVNKFYTLAGGSTSSSSGTIIWTNQEYSSTSNVWCYGYNNGTTQTDTLDWRHYTVCSSSGDHIIVDINGGTF